MANDLSVKASINTSEFSSGVQKLRNELKSLNTSLIETRTETKRVQQEYNSLIKKQEALRKEMGDNATDEQKKDFEDLSRKIAQTAVRLGDLKAAEKEIASTINSTSKKLTEQKTATTQTAEATQKASTELKGMATAIKGVIAAIGVKTLFEYLIGSNAEMEQYLTSFEVMLGSAEKAEQLMSSLTDLAARTPFELTGVTSAAQSLMNYGVAADEVIDKLTQLGDLSGGNAVKLDRVTLAYGQMLAKGKVSGEELRQMTEAGVPLLQALADSLGQSTAETQKLISASAVSIDDLNTAMGTLTSGSGKFSGMMEKQSQTFTGMLSTLKDTLTQFGRDTGEEAFGKVKASLSELMEQIDGWEEDGTLEKVAEELGTTVANVIDIIRSGIEFIWEYRQAIASVVVSVGAFKAAIAIGNVITSTANAVKTLTTATNAMTVAQKATNAVAAANPYVLLAGIILSLTAAVTTYALTAENASDKTKELAEETSKIKSIVSDAVFDYEAETAILKSKIDAYEELRNKENLTALEEERLAEIAADIENSTDGHITAVNKLTGEYKDLSAQVEEYVKKQSQAVKLSAMEEQAKEAYKQIEKLKKERKEALTSFSPAFQTGFGPLDTFIATVSYDNEIQRNSEAVNEIDNQIADLEKIISEYEGTLTEGFIETTETVTASAQSTAKSTEELTEALETATKKTTELASEAKSLSSAFKEQKENGSLSVDTILSLVDAGYAAALAVESETGAVKLDAAAYRDLAQAKIEANKATLQADKSEIEKSYASRIESAWKSGNVALARQIEKQRDSETASYTAQIAALNRIDFSSVASGTYGQKSSTAKEEKNEEKKMSIPALNTAKSLADDFAKMFKNQLEESLSEKDIDNVISNGFGAALVADPTGDVTLNAEKYKGLAEAVYDTYIAELTIQKAESEKANKSTTAIDIQIRKYEELKKGIDDVIKGGNIVEEPDYAAANKAFKEYAAERKKIIEDELKLKKKASQEAITALDKEIEARKRLNEDKDIQSEIDRTIAQLNYGRLDKFSRAQLERQLQGLYNEQAETNWERSMRDRKDEINAEYSVVEEAAENEKNRITEAADYISNSLTTVSEQVAASAEQLKLAAEKIGIAFGRSQGSTQYNNSNNYNTQTAVTINNAANFTAEQIVNAVISKIQSSPIM